MSLRRRNQPAVFGFADVTAPYDLHQLEAKLLLLPESIERSVALLSIRELKRARVALQMMRDVHADVAFDTPEDTAVQAKAVALADDALGRTSA